MLNRLTVASNKIMLLWRHLMRALTAVWLLSGLGSPAMAAEISVTSTFVDASTKICSNPLDVMVEGIGCFTVQVAQNLNWTQALAACNALGNGYTLPNNDQLAALYAAYPNNALDDESGWQTSTPYWSSSVYDNSNHHSINLFNGHISFSGNDTDLLVTCRTNAI